MPAAAACLLLPLPALAQQQGVQQPPPAQQQTPAEWAKLPRMQLERQYAGPLRDTIIQRWRDPVDGTICYVYLPITAAHSPPGESGYVQYGANTIGSLSCISAAPAPAPRGAGGPAATTTRPSAGSSAPPRASPSPAPPAPAAADTPQPRR
jgi:hypothetical protein